MGWDFAFSVPLGLLGFLVLLFVFYVIQFRRNHFWEGKNLPSELPSASTFGFLAGRPFWEIDAEWYKKHGRIFGAYQGMKPMLFLGDPEVARTILVKDFHIFPNRRRLTTSDKIAAAFVSVLRGDDWKRVRSVITPAFSTGKLKKMVGLMNETVLMTIENLVNIAEKEAVADCKRVFGGFTLDIIATTAFGTKLNSARDPDNIFIRNARQVFNVSFPWRFFMIFFFPRISQLLGIRFFKASVLEFFEDLTNTVVQKRKEKHEYRDDFLQHLLEAQMRNQHDTQQILSEQETTEGENEVMSEECQSYLKQYSKNKTITTDEFVAQCILFFLAGFDTTATTISMTLYFLALNPDCQKKVVEEVDKIWRDNPEPDYETLSKLKYLDAAISETLRLIPPAPRIERMASQDYTIESAGITIPKGMIVGFPVYAIHMDPEFFPNPEKYDPERFLPENKDLLQPYTYMPFGVGPRNCVGMRFALMEIKVCLLHVFKHVTFEPCAETKIPPEIFTGSGLYQPKAVNLKIVKRAQ